MKYQLDNQILDVEIVKKNNKNTYIRVKDNKIIYVTTGLFTTKTYIKKLLDENYVFLKKALSKIEKQDNKKDKFFLLGVEYSIIKCSNIKLVEIDINKNIIYYKDESSLNKWLKKQTEDILKKRLDYNYQRFQEKIPYPKLKIRNMKTRWGVCNRKNISVTLNSRLLEYSIEKLDYVIIHELSHFVHFNHSTSFWTVVEKYCPNYKLIRKELKD